MRRVELKKLPNDNEIIRMQSFLTERLRCFSCFLRKNRRFCVKRCKKIKKSIDQTEPSLRCGRFSAGGKEDRERVKRGRIEETSSREKDAFNRLKFNQKTDKIILRKKSVSLCEFFVKTE